MGNEELQAWSQFLRWRRSSRFDHEVCFVLVFVLVLALVLLPLPLLPLLFLRQRRRRRRRLFLSQFLGVFNRKRTPREIQILDLMDQRSLSVAKR